MVKYTREKSLNHACEYHHIVKIKNRFVPSNVVFTFFLGGVPILLFFNILSKTKKCWPIKNCG